MTSAFGIDHGDVSKAWRKKKAQPMSPRAAATERAVRNVAAAPSKIANAPLNLKAIGNGAGRAAGATGTATKGVLTAKPGLTGAAIVGGGGYGLYAAGKKRQAKKPSAPKGM